MTLLAAAVAACSGGSADPAGSPAPVPHTPSAPHTQSATTAPTTAPYDAAAGPQHLLSLKVSNPTVTHLALGSRWLVYSQAKSAVAQDFPNEVVAVDLATYRSHVVAGSAWPKGQSDWVLTDGDWVFWTDQSIAGADSPAGLRWAIRGQDLRTGRTVTVTKSAFDSPVPLPVAGNGKVVWAQQERTGSTASALQEYVIASGSLIRLATIPAGQLPDQLAIGGRGVYYDAATVDAKKSDVWRVSAPGSPPHRVTSNGQARAVVADPGSATTAWSNGSLTSDPVSFTIARSDGAGTVVKSGLEYDLRLGSGFASYISAGGDLMVVPTPSGVRRRIASNLSVPCRTATAGHRIAYCTQLGAEGPITITVDQFGR